MSSRPIKRVLVVDDTRCTCNDVRWAFLAHNESVNGVYTFKVDVSTSIEDITEIVGAAEDGNQYDVLVLDLSSDATGNDRRGLQLAAALALYSRFGQAIPVEIIFTADTDLRRCVQTMRCGAWDVIDKRDVDDTSPFELVVESAVSRLRTLDLQQLLNSLALEWLQQHVTELQPRFGGQVVAIWHEPDIRIVASGKDAFELESSLESWRQDHPAWMYPLVVQIPEVATVSGPMEFDHEPK